MCFVAVARTHYENINANTTLQALAQEYSKKLTRAVPKYIRLPQEYEIADVLNIYGLNTLPEKKEFDLTLAITDIQEANLNAQYGPLEITAQIAGVNLNYGLVTLLLGVGLFNGRFMFCFNYVEPLIPVAWVESFSKIFIEQLIKDEPWQSA